MKMKRSPSFSSSSSSSCIESSPPIAINKPKSKSKRNYSTSKSRSNSRAKKIVDLQNQESNQNQINPPPPDTPSSRGNGRRSSNFRGVTRHRWTGRYEAHLWDKTTWNSIQNKKGRQIYLGAYDNEEAAARTYDLAAIKYWGPTTILNFPQIETYAKEIQDMQKMSKDEFMASLRRKSSGFSRGVSKYRGVARHHHNGRWEARIGRVFGSKYLYLGTYSTQEEAAMAYDKAAIEYRGPSAITNFDISDYPDKLKEYQQRMEQENPIPRSSSSTDITQAITQTEHVQEHQQQQQNTEAIDAQQVMDEIPYEEESQPMMLMMDPCDEHEHPWNMCLDSTGFNNSCLPIDVPFEEPVELPDLFADSGFDEEIDFLFDFPVVENQDYLSSGSTLCGVQEENSPRKEGGEAAESSSSPLSSASVCTIA